MTKENKTAALITISGVTGAMLSVFFDKWLNDPTYPWWVQLLLIAGYSIFVLILLVFVVKGFKLAD